MIARCAPATSGRLSEKYRPTRLSDVVGQPGPLKALERFVRTPHPMCWLFEGPPGVGKTSSAYALGAELGATDEFSGLHTVVGSELTIERARELFARSLHLRPLSGPSGWKLLVIEELENLSPQCGRFLKVALETQLPSKTIVVATSNDATGLEKALRQRFTVLTFSGGSEFAAACAEKLLHVWQAERPSDVVSLDVLSQGWDGGEFSMRKALDALQWA